MTQAPHHTLSIERLACMRGDRLLFKDLSFSVSSGSCLLVQGTNGSGKSSLLRILAGLLTPASGEVRYDDQLIDSHETYPRQMVYVGHDLGVEAGETVTQHLGYWAKLRGEASLIEAAIHYFDLDAWRKVACTDLSAGLRQKLALARLVVIPSNVWLLDEPISHLDSRGAALLQQLIQTRIERGGIVIISAQEHFVGNMTIKLNDYI